MERAERAGPSLAWVTGLITAAHHLSARPDIHRAFINAAILEMAPEFLRYGALNPAEIAAIGARHPAELDAIWERNAHSMASEFEVEALMATTPLGSADLGAAWFGLAPDLITEELA